MASESGRWYYAETGKPCYTLVGSNGKERRTTLRDARKLNLYPSVTSIIGILDKPGLTNWLIEQMLLAALTLPRIDGESEERWIERIKTDSKERGKKAADRGTLLHGDIELCIQGKPHGSKAHIAEIAKQMQELGLDLMSGTAEHTFAHPDGYAGKTDWHEGFVVCDFKSKDRIEPGKKLAWDEQSIQLSAYARGLGITEPRCLNIFVGVDDYQVVIHEWSAEELARGLEMFQLLLRLWQLKNKFEPAL